MGRSDWLVIAVSGATCSGKTTLAGNLNRIFRGSVLLHQDDFFLDVKDDHHTRVPELNHINFEILSSLDGDGFMEKIRSVLDGPVLPGFTSTELAAAFPNSIPPTFDKPSIPNLLILDGFLLLNEQQVADLCDVKLFVTLDEGSCWARRSVRTYDPPDPAGYFQLCVWPHYLRHLEEVRNVVPNVVYLDGTQTTDELLNHALGCILPQLCPAKKLP